MSRPSGATLRVFKTFDNYTEYAAQLKRMKAAPPEVAIEVRHEPTAMYTFSMPLAQGPVPVFKYRGLMNAYELLWAHLPAPDFPDRGAYLEYVLGRNFSTEQSEEVRTLLQEAKFRAGALAAGLPPHAPDRQCFTHGDATLSNAVMTERGIRLIDFSPRLTPAEREIDLAKLLFSGLGFDTTEADGVILRGLLRDTPSYRDSSEAVIQFYLCTHLIRVLTREPPTSKIRLDFYQKVLHHVA